LRCCRAQERKSVTTLMCSNRQASEIDFGPPARWSSIISQTTTAVHHEHRLALVGLEVLAMVMSAPGMHTRDCSCDPSSTATLMGTTPCRCETLPVLSALSRASRVSDLTTIAAGQTIMKLEILQKTLLEACQSESHALCPATKFLGSGIRQCEPIQHAPFMLRRKIHP
jgi:hypothetical protein